MHNLLDHYRQLRELISESSVKFDEMLKQHTYTRMGGKADLYVTPAHYEELQLVLHPRTHGFPLTILGFGSNLIVKDGGSWHCRKLEPL